MIEKASYLAAGRAETRALLAESGDADMVFTLDPSGYARLGDVDSVATTAVPIPRVVTLKVNASHPFFEDVRARQALSLSMNRAGIASAITRFPEAAAGQLFPPALNKWHAGDDGILVKDGERFSIVLRTFPDRPELPLIAAALQDMWKEIGIELEVSVVTPDPVGTALQDFGKGGGDWGAMGWDKPEIAEALERVAATSDDAARAADIALVAKAIHEDLPLIPVVWYQHTVSIAKGLNGVVIDPLQRSYGLSKVSWEE